MDGPGPVPQGGGNATSTSTRRPGSARWTRSTRPSENAKTYIDFASKHGISLLLVEGWNTGWTPEWYLDRMHQFSFTRSTPDLDLINYLGQVDDGMALYQRLGIHNIKIGQVGSRLNMKAWHHGQFGVRYYRSVLKNAAEHGLAVDFCRSLGWSAARWTSPPGSWTW